MSVLPTDKKNKIIKSVSCSSPLRGDEINRGSRKGYRGQPLSQDERERNTKIAVTRAGGERPFATYKRHYGLARTRFMGLATGGVANLLRKLRKPRNRRLNASQTQEVVRWLLHQPEQNWTLKKLQHAVKEKFALDVGITTLWSMLKRESFSHIKCPSCALQTKER